MGKLIHGTAYSGMLRFSLIDSKDIVQTSKEKHGLSYLPTVVLGRFITASGLVCLGSVNASRLLLCCQEMDLRAMLSHNRMPQVM